MTMDNWQLKQNKMKRIVILGAGESGAGAAVLAKAKVKSLIPMKAATSE